MSTEIKSSPASTREPTNIDQATDVISNLIRSESTPEVKNPAVSRQEEPAPDPEYGTEDPDIEVPDEEIESASQAEVPTETPEASEKPSKEAKTESPSDEESQDTEEIELDPGQLATLHGLDEDDLLIDEQGSIRIKAKVDGKIAEVPISELKDSYQLAKTSQQRLQKLSEDRKTFEEQRQQIGEQLTQQHQQMTDALTAIEQQYAHDWHQVDWKRLREEDPENYTIKRQDYDDRMRQIGAFKNEVASRQQQQLLEKQEQQQKLWQEGALRLNDAFTTSGYKSAPKWDESEKQRLVSWMGEQGFTQNDIGDVSSHLVFKWARDSMLRKDEQSAARKSMKRVIKLPKVKAAKPGSKTNERAVAKQTSVHNAKARQRKAGGNLDSTTELIKQIFNS